MSDKTAIKVNELETKIKVEIINALNVLKSVDAKDQLLTFLKEDIEELYDLHVEKEEDEL